MLKQLLCTDSTDNSIAWCE